MLLVSEGILSILNLCLPGLNFLQEILHFPFYLVIVCDILGLTLQQLQLVEQGSDLLILHQQLAFEDAYLCLLV